MPSLIGDEILETFALHASSGQLPARVLEKYDGLLDRVNYYFPFVPGQTEEGWRAIVGGFKA